MKKTSRPTRPRNAFDAMQQAMGRGGQEAVIREALERVDGKPTPVLGAMQVEMSSEAQIRLLHDVIRCYLDEHGHASTLEWAQHTPPSPAAPPRSSVRLVSGDE